MVTNYLEAWQDHKPNRKKLKEEIERKKKKKALETKT